MRVVVYEFMSLDGVVQAPGGPEEDTDGGFAHGGWSHPYFDVEVMGPIVGESMDNAEALLFGRRTWQGMAAAWPERAGDPYADRMNSIKKYVVTDTLGEDDLTWNNTELITLEGVADKVACPILILHGENDRVVPLAEAKKLYERAGSKNKTLRIFTEAEGGAEHCQVDNRQLGVDFIGDWLIKTM